MPQWLQQFVKFCIVGGMNTVVDFGIYLLLTRWLGLWPDQLVVPQMISMGCATVNSYFWNSYWTFQTDRKMYGTLVIKFLTVSLSGYILNTIFFAGLVGFGIPDLVAKVGLIGFLVMWNFVGNKWWVYTAK